MPTKTQEIVSKWTECPECGAKKGEFHHPGCDWEECPFCHKQLICCSCCYRELGVQPGTELTSEQQKRLEQILTTKGRVPVGQEIDCATP